MNNNFKFLKENDYWGRGIIIGNTNNKYILSYFIMGRSENSRNRCFKNDGDDIYIEPFDESKVTDPDLIIYYPIKFYNKNIIITNGDQTDTIERELKMGGSFESALRKRTFEPDDPHFTPRISGIVDLNTGNYKMSILKNIDGTGQKTGRYFYEFEPVTGYARFLHTYMKNENPLPTFEGEPKEIRFDYKNIEDFTYNIWNNLDYDNKISICTLEYDFNDEKILKYILNRRLGD